jgi:tetratricopeptide (TPR) repeat protein
VRICSACANESPDSFRFCPGCGAALAQVSQTESFASGRYVVRRFLGEGGKKKVYLAHDTVLDRDVAFGLIKVEPDDEVATTRVTREAQAMGRLGSHPHVVTVFDLGEHDGRPYMVTELMGGGDVEGLLDRAEGGRVPIQDALEIAKAVCRGLEFAHERQLVHRDLKPGNVWLTEEGVAKIGDFGLALALDRSRLTTEGLMVGTVAYMPPEQALGGDVGPRADLYSLGAMLYELITGRPPFLGDEPVAVISQHINTPAVAPSWHNPDCPRALETLILRLLAKDPGDRPESAADVLAALAAIEIEPGPAADAVETQTLDSLAGGVFVGRRHELAELKSALEGAFSGEARLVTLVGEPGIGKTRIAQELATYARLRKAVVLWGRCYETEGAPAYWPWVQAIRSYVRDCDPARLRSELGAGAVDVAEAVPDVRERLPDVGPARVLEDPQTARFRLFDSITAFLKDAARSQPILLVLDDLHWADEGSLRLLEFVARELSGARLLLVGAYRDVDLSRRHPLSRTLGELSRERLFDRILIRGLTQDDVGRFVEATCGIAPPAALVEAVYTQTEGNPLFVTEVVRLLVQEGELAPDRLSGRQTWSVRIPEGVREVIGRRLDRLSERCNETLTIASVVGREFAFEQLEQLIDDLSSDRLLELLEEALAARVIEELPRTLGHYQFTHALIQETLAEELSLTRRLQLHARIAESLEALYGEDAGQHADELAHHFGEAKALLGPDKLVRYSLIAGESALSAYAYEQAMAHFEHVLAAKDAKTTDDDTAAALFGLGRAQVAGLARYEMERAVANLRRAFDYYADASDVGRAVAVAAYPIPFSLGVGLAPLRELTVRALTLVPVDSPDAGTLLAQHGWIAGVFDADYDAGQAAFQQALSIAHARADATLERRTLANAAFADVFHLRWDDCLDNGLRAIELSEQAGDLYSELTARRAVCWTLRTIGDPKPATAHARAELEHAERLRDRWSLSSARWDVAMLAYYEGDADEARRMAELGLAIQPRDPRHLALRALLEYQAGNFETGRMDIARLEEAAANVPPPGPIVEHVVLAAAVPVVARIAGTDEGLDLARATAERVLALPRLAPIIVRLVNSGLAMIAVQTRDAAAAEELYRTLESAGGTVNFHVGLSFDRLLALLAATRGRADTAVAHFEHALVFCERAGYRPEYAWTAADYAEALLGRASPGDRERALALEETAVGIARELGLKPLIDRVVARREILGA